MADRIVRESLAAQQLRGAAALTDMLAQIGGVDCSDRAVVQILVENELYLRALLNFALRGLARKEGPCSLGE